MVRKLPYSKGCFVCGHANPVGLQARFMDNGESVFCEHTFDDNRIGYPGTVHGGLLMSLLDETMVWAGCARQGRFCVLADIKVRLLKPVSPGVPIIVRGIFQGEKLGMWFINGEITDKEGNLYARAEGRYSPLSPDQSKQVTALLVSDPEGIQSEELLIEL
jgi:uncharacterized protein (TIGR00369 family)